jgi:hypothetical protein
MIRTGGIFLLCIGSGILVGAVLGERNLVIPLIVGAVLAFVTQGIFAKRLSRHLGKPTRVQIAALVSGIVLETLASFIAAFVFLVRHYDWRTFWLWILLIVGCHLLIIAIAQGPLLLILGGLCIANALIAFLSPEIPLSLFWLIDGVLKIIIGGWMLVSPPSWKWGRIV